MVWILRCQGRGRGQVLECSRIQLAGDGGRGGSHASAGFYLAIGWPMIPSLLCAGPPWALSLLCTLPMATQPVPPFSSGSSVDILTN
jgi:hypothetical protein